MKKLPAIFMALLVLILPVAVSAAQFVGNETVTALQGTAIEENYYGAGAMVNFGAAATQDVYLAGANINVYGEVGEDLTVAGSNILILGSVGDDLRVAGGTINILKTIGGEAMVAGGVVNFAQGAELKSGGFLAGGQLNIDGKLAGNTIIRGGKIIINGEINGNLDIIADEQLVITDKAVITGNVQYASRQEAQISTEAKVSGVLVKSDHVFKERAPRSGNNQNVWGLMWGLALFKLIVLVASGLIAFGLFGKHLEKLLKEANDGFGNNLLLGFGLAIALPLAGVVLLITVLLMPFAALLGILYCLFMLIAKVAAGMLFGVWLFKFLTKKEQSLTWQNTVAGIIALSVISWIPIVGWVINAIFVLGLFGAMWAMAYAKYLKTK